MGNHFVFFFFVVDVSYANFFARYLDRFSRLDGMVYKAGDVPVESQWSADVIIGFSFKLAIDFQRSVLCQECGYQFDSFAPLPFDDITSFG